MRYNICKKKLKIQSAHTTLTMQKMNITGSSGRINGIKLHKVIQVEILECTGWPYYGVAALTRFSYKKRIGVSPEPEKVQR